MARLPVVKLVLVKKQTTDDFGYLCLRVLIPGERRYKHRSLGYKVPVQYWDEAGERVLKGFKNSDIVNKDIANEKNKLEIEIANHNLSGKTITGDTLVKKLKGQDRKSVV